MEIHQSAYPWCTSSSWIPTPYTAGYVSVFLCPSTWEAEVAESEVQDHPVLHIQARQLFKFFFLGGVVCFCLLAFFFLP